MSICVARSQQKNPAVKTPQTKVHAAMRKHNLQAALMRNCRRIWCDNFLQRISDKLGAFLLIFLLGLMLPAAAQDSGRKLSAALDGQRPADANPETQQFAGPIKLFDNLYYIG